jgi:hypothetical protein
MDRFLKSIEKLPRENQDKSRQVRIGSGARFLVSRDVAKLFGSLSRNIDSQEEDDVFIGRWLSHMGILLQLPISPRYDFDWLTGCDHYSIEDIAEIPPETLRSGFHHSLLSVVGKMSPSPPVPSAWLNLLARQQNCCELQSTMLHSPYTASQS